MKGGGQKKRENKKKRKKVDNMHMHTHRKQKERRRRKKKEKRLHLWWRERTLLVTLSWIGVDTKGNTHTHTHTLAARIYRRAGMPRPRPAMGIPGWPPPCALAPATSEVGALTVSSTDRIMHAASEAAVSAFTLTMAGSHTAAS